MPGLIESIIRGSGTQGLKSYLARSGAVPRIAENGFQRESGAVSRPFLQKLKNGARALMFGNHGPDVLKQRLIQGGLLGKGGIIRGSLAYDPSIAKSFKTHGLRALYSNNALENVYQPVLGGTVNNALMVGIPGYAGYRAVQRGDRPELGRAIGEGLGWTLAVPFGLAGQGLVAGSAMFGRNVIGPKLPEIAPLPGYEGAPRSKHIMSPYPF